MIQLFTMGLWGRVRWLAQKRHGMGLKRSSYLEMWLVSVGRVGTIPEEMVITCHQCAWNFIIFHLSNIVNNFEHFSWINQPCNRAFYMQFLGIHPPKKKTPKNTKNHQHWGFKAVNMFFTRCGDSSLCLMKTTGMILQVVAGKLPIGSQTKHSPIIT